MKDRLKKTIVALLQGKKARRMALGFLCVCAGLFLLYAALGFWVLPAYVKSRMEAVARDKLQRTLLIESVDFNPFSLTLDVKGVSLSEPQSEARFAAFEQLYATVSPASVFRLTPVVTEFKLVRPFVHVARFEDGKRNFDDIVSLFAGSEEEKADKEATPAAAPEKRPQNAAERRAAIRKRKFGIYNFQIVDARIELENRERGTKTLISDFHVGLPYLYRGPIRGIARHVEPRFEALVNGKRLEIVREKPSPQSRDSILRFNMDNIDLTRIFHYLPLNPAYRLREGWLDLHLSLYIHRPKEAQTSVDIGGQAVLRSIGMTRHDKPFFSMEKLDLQLGANSPDKGIYRIDRLEIVRPALHAASDRNGVLDVANLLAKAGEEAAVPDEDAASAEEDGAVAQTQAAEQKEMTFSLKELLVRKAQLRYENHAGGAVAGASLQDVDLVVQDAEMDMGAQRLKVGLIRSPGGRFDAALFSGAPAAAADAAESKAGQMPGLTVQVDKFSLENWQGKVRHTASRDVAAWPFSAAISRFGVTVEETSLDLAAQTLSVGAVQSLGGTFDVTLEDHPAGNPPVQAKADSAPAFRVDVGKVGIAGWSGRFANHNRGAAGLPVSAVVGQFGLKVEKAQVDMKTQSVSVAHIRSAGGHFDVLMENAPPVVPAVSSAAGQADSPYHVRIGRLEIADWSGKARNSNRLDPFETPFSAVLSRAGVVIDEADVRLKDRVVSVAAIRSAGGTAELELEPYHNKPSLYGKRAAERARLLASVMAAQKAAPEKGFAVSIGKLAVSDWTARLKNRNTTDIAGLPVSGQASRLNLTAAGIRLDTEKRSIAAGEIVSQNGELAAQIEKHEKAVPKRAPVNDTPAVMPSQPPYAVSVGKLSFAGWSMKGRNVNLEKSLGVSLTDFDLTAQDVAFPSGNPFRFSMRAAVNKTGRLSAEGKAGLSPLDVDMALDVKAVSLVAIQPYIDDYVNLTMNRADLSLAGQVRLKETPAGRLEGGYKGDATLARLHTVDQVNKDTFVRWNALSLRDIDANVAPLSVRIGEAELNRFFARLILNPDGRLNVHNILRKDAGGQISLTETEGELDDLAAAGDERRHLTGKKGNVTARPLRPDTAHDAQGDGLPLVTVDKLVLKNGRVRFTDSFIKPNYTANITDMEGTVSGLSSDPGAVARLDLRGQVNHAPLVAAGTVSPMREHLTLDVNAQVRGMELAQFSSYTTRYIGYGIDKGKLSFDVAYKLEDGVLVAQNRLILDQLTFGEKAPGEPVTSLPVELAVSLLKDSNGVIDINLPIGGSLEDPSFSIGGILAQVFMSSLKRVILSPFAFLSIEFGKGAEMAWLDFEPGSAVIPEKENAKLEAMAKAFAERPELKLDITGRYDPVADRAGLAREAIQRKVRMEKRKDLQEKGLSVAMGTLKVTDSEYPALLERVYQEADIKKPRNLIGLQKKLTVKEMEELMEAQYQATEEEFLALAYQRAEQVKAWLAGKGKVADSRIFILASKAGESGENGETASRVDFAIGK